MKTYIAILKGINVGGHKKIMMADLRKMLCEISYIGEVNTYIQSGNIVFKASEENTDVLENLIQQKIADHYSFEVSTIVLSKENLSSIIDSNPYTEEEIKRLHCCVGSSNLSTPAMFKASVERLGLFCVCTWRF